MLRPGKIPEGNFTGPEDQFDPSRHRIVVTLSPLTAGATFNLLDQANQTIQLALSAD